MSTAIGNPSSPARMGRLSGGLVMVLIGFSLFANETARRRARDIVERANILQTRVHALQTDALILERLSLERVTTGDGQLNAELRARIQAVREDVVKLIPDPDLALLSAEGSHAWLAFRDVLFQYQASLSNVIKLQDAEQQLAARDEVEEELLPLGDKLTQLGTALVAAGQAEASRMDEQARSTREQANWLIALGGLLTFALVLGAGEWGRKQILRREEIIHRQLKQLDAKNQELDAFAGRVAHDLRNIISNVLLCFDLLPRAPVDQRPKLLERGRGSVRKMNEFLESLLDYSRSAEPLKGRCLVPAVVRTVARQNEAALEEHRVELQLRTPPFEVSLRPEILESVVRNLLTNAIKYLGTQPAPRVSIDCWLRGNQVELAVSDNGMGIPAKQITALFTPFHRGPHDGIPGHGLGLATVKRLVEVHGGRISVRSTEGVGTTFTVLIPLADPAPQPVHAPMLRDLATTSTGV